MPDRNLWGRFQDVVAGPYGQPSNIDLIREAIANALSKAQTPTVGLPPSIGLGFPTRTIAPMVSQMQNMRPQIPQSQVPDTTPLITQALANPEVLPQSTPQGMPEATTPSYPGVTPNDNTRLILSALLGGALPAIAGITGSMTGNDELLAGASGFAQGFGTQFAKGEEAKRKQFDKPVFTIDPSTGEVTNIGTIPSTAKSVVKPQPKAEKEETSDEAIRKEIIEASSPVEKSVEKSKETAEKINKFVVPKYNQKTEKLQQNTETGEYRVVPK